MPLDKINDRLGGIPDISNARPAQVPDVPDLSKSITDGLDRINQVVEKFSPLSKAQRAAEIAKYAVVQHAFELGRMNKGDKMAELLAQVSGHQSPFMNAFNQTGGQLAAYNRAGVRPRGAAPVTKGPSNAALRLKALRDKADAIRNAGQNATIQPAAAAATSPTGVPMASAPVAAPQSFNPFGSAPVGQPVSLIPEDNPAYPSNG